MAKFKVGDKVIAKKNAPYGITTNGWKGAVTRVVNNNWIRVMGPGAIGSLGFSVKSEYFDLVTECNQKIVITSDGTTTLARLYEGKNVVKTAEAKCCPNDEFDFQTGAKLAIDRLLEKYLDWDAFKAGKIAVKVTKDNFKEFVTVASTQGLKFKPDENFNPFVSIHYFLVCNLRPDVKENEIYIVYEDDTLKIGHWLGSLEEFIWA